MWKSTKMFRALGWCEQDKIKGLFDSSASLGMFDLLKTWVFWSLNPKSWWLESDRSIESISSLHSSWFILASGPNTRANRFHLPAHCSKDSLLPQTCLYRCPDKLQISLKRFQGAGGLQKKTSSRGGALFHIAWDCSEGQTLVTTTWCLACLQIWRLLFPISCPL